MTDRLTDAARVILLRAIDWPTADLISLGLPAEVVSNGPPVAIATGDTKGGRDNMPGESMRAAAQHAWREVGRECGEPA